MGPIFATITQASEPAAVILLYNRFGDPRLPAINVRLEQFEAHLEELANPRYTVLPVPEIVRALKNSESLPDRTIGITIDDSYSSVYHEAWPRLRDAGFPFTLFVAPGRVDRAAADNMTWEQIAELQQAGVTIGNHTRTRRRLPGLAPVAAGREIDDANLRLAAELPAGPAMLFAYPYGEFSLQNRDQVINRGYAAAFGQHSGVIGPGSDRFSLPRFGMNEKYADIDRFRLIVNALPLQVSDILPVSPILTDNPPAFGFMVDPKLGKLNTLACFESNTGAVKLEFLEHRIEARFSKPFPPGRIRVNCTMRGPEGRWRWFGRHFMANQ